MESEGDGSPQWSGIMDLLRAIGVILGYSILGIYWDNGKENGSYYNVFVSRYDRPYIFLRRLALGF